jgi:cytoskeleton protein RodZ
MSETGATAGQRLKAERERRGMSAQKAADELRLDSWVIDALEADDYERLGPAVYAKGHLKRYASYLGLPCPEIMAGYESRMRAPEAPASQPASVRMRTDTPAVSNLAWQPIVGWAAAALLVLGVLWWKPWHQRGAVPAASPPVAANPGAAPAVKPAEPANAEVTSAAPSTAPAPARSAAAPETDAGAGTGRARLRLSFSADSRVDVHDAAGRRVFAGNGRANSVKIIAGIAPLRVYLGFASGVQLEINNRAVAIGPQFMAGDVARFEAGADGVLRRDSRSLATPATATPAAVTPAAAPAAAPGAQPRNARPTG